MSLPGRHSLLWRLAGALALFCLLLVSLYADVGRLLVQAASYLPESTRQVLREQAREAEAAWREGGSAGVDAFLEQLREREGIWAVMVDEHKHSLSSTPLDEAQQQRLDFVRRLDFPVGRPGSTPTFYVPFSDGQARLVLELPQRLDPRQYVELWELLLQRLLPALLAVALAVLLYRLLIAPLAMLRRQAAALSSGDLSARLGPQVTQRKDELGELARSFDHMAERLQGTVAFQRQLLRDLSHELRTPLARLRVAGESEQDVEALRQRLAREVLQMEKLVGDALELVWLDTERPRLPSEEVDVARLWDVLRENAAFETGWPVERMPCDLPADCRVFGHLNGLAQALENILRNAIRHSPQGGSVRLGGRREAGDWLLWIEDQGPGVAESELEAIFRPFTRLSAARPGGDGFGLGLAIARSMVETQGGRVWAHNVEPGLRVHIQLPAT
ncbi:sensor histidine kinase [Ectopseudomonas hydrolytica]|uniref:sensor histidine kinase n=1 Tax=Ectopseudomonas hydrolytica TaxID=2493633 RepID=UPI0018A73A49|nr:sensor histidine kinase [Pseudomonas hydrolytica]MBF8161263.1 sensor histidine kinase [Pseudomonas mendocina]UTH30020.1 sensor histidine kinase [Pseudomonas hydrolytica]UZZ09030.1 sensor histidine kinase [Pseudomonas mendocina]